MTSYPLRGIRLINNRIFPDMILHPSPELDVVSKRYLYILMLEVRTMAELPTFLATFGLDVDIEVRRPRQYTVIISVATRVRDNAITMKGWFSHLPRAKVLCHSALQQPWTPGRGSIDYETRAK